jgi:hypothetical protein
VSSEGDVDSQMQGGTVLKTLYRSIAIKTNRMSKATDESVCSDAQQWRQLVTLRVIDQFLLRSLNPSVRRCSSSLLTSAACKKNELGETMEACEHILKRQDSRCFTQ